MCSGGNRRAEERKAKREQERLDQQAREAQDELDRLADDRNAIAAQQVADNALLQQQFSDQRQAQIDNAADLQEKQDAKLLGIKDEQNRKSAELATAQEANVKSMAAAQAVKIGGIRSRGQAVSSSLQILGKKNLTGPSASSTKGKSVRKGAASTAAQVARGSSRNRGPNLSI